MNKNIEYKLNFIRVKNKKKQNELHNVELSLPVIEFSEVLSCSLSLSTSSGWTCSYKELPNHSDWDWLSTGVRESDTYITRPVSAATTKRKPSAASRIKCFSSYSESRNG